MTSKKQNKQSVDLSLRQFIKDLGGIAGGTALLASTPWLQSFTVDKLSELKKEKARLAVIGTGSEDSTTFIICWILSIWK